MWPLDMGKEWDKINSILYDLHGNLRMSWNFLDFIYETMLYLYWDVFIILIQK